MKMRMTVAYALSAVLSLAVGVVSASDMELMEAMESGDMKTAVSLAKKTLATKPNDYEANLAMAFYYESPFTMGSPCGGTASHGISFLRRHQRMRLPSGSPPIPST